MTAPLVSELLNFRDILRPLVFTTSFIKKMKHFATFIALLISSPTFARSKKIEDLKNYYDAHDFQSAQNIIDDILEREKPQELQNENLEQEINESIGEKSEEIGSVETEEEKLEEEKNSEEQQEEEKEENNIIDEEDQLLAFFFDGLIRFEQKNLEGAEESFKKILELKRDWEQISEVYYWLAQISFEQKKISQGIDFLKSIDKEKISQEEVDKIIQNYLIGEVDNVELNRCVCKNSENNFIVKKWLDRQMELPLAEQYVWLIKYFLKQDEYQKYRKAFFDKVKIKKKGKYNLAVILPLDLENSPKNSRFYDFYNLASMALEDFEDRDKFEFYFYDSKNNGEGLDEILHLEEMKNMDIIINTSKKNLDKVSQFSKENSILLYDFASKSLNSIKDNSFAFLAQASQETYSLGAAKFILEEVKKQPEHKNITIVYVDKDFKIAEIFKNYLSFNGLQTNEISFSNEDLKNILYKVRVNLDTIKKEKAKKLKKQEAGENVSEEEETEKLDVMKILEESDYVFVASPDMVLMGNVIGISEQLNITPKVFCDYALLNTNLAEEIFNKENFFYLTSNEFGYDDVRFMTFKEKYFDKFKKFPSLEMFFNYNALQKILNKINQNQINILHDEQKINLITF